MMSQTEDSRDGNRDNSETGMTKKEESPPAGRRVRFADANLGECHDSNPEEKVTQKQSRVSWKDPSGRLSPVEERENNDKDTTKHANSPLVGSPTARIIRQEIQHGSHPTSLGETAEGKCTLQRSNSLPGRLRLRPIVHRLLVAHRPTPSASIIKKEFRSASLKKVDQQFRRQSHTPLISAKRHVLDPELYQSLLAHAQRSPSANVIKKEFRYATLKKVEEEARKRRFEPLISTKDLLLDPDVYELLVAHSRRSPSANVIKKEFRYACLRKVNREGGYYKNSHGLDDRDEDEDEDAASFSSISTLLSNFHIDTSFDNNNDNDDDLERGLYVYDWIMDLEPRMPEPDLFPYYLQTAYSEGGRRMSGSTLATNQTGFVSILSSSNEPVVVVPECES